MKNLIASIPHRLTRSEVKKRIEDQLLVARREYASHLANLRESWTGDRLDFSLTALGQSISGHLLVDDSAVHVEVALPWILAILAGPVKRKLEDKARLLLAAP
jgi:hypothetical protein